MKRALRILLGWALLFAASPGVLAPGGSLLLAILGAGVVGAALLTPPGERQTRAFLLEAAAGGLGASFALWWVVYVSAGAFLYIIPVLGIYQWCAGWLMRRFARRLPAGPAVTLGWLAGEVLRTLLIPPLGLGWLLLGHHTADHLWLAGSARIWGIEGLSFVVAALAGCVAQFIVDRKAMKSSMLLGMGSVALAAGLGAASAAPASVPGPRALVVQPGLSQGQKTAGSFLRNLMALSFRALDAEALKAAPPVDFVAWGESMLPLPLAEQGVVPALKRGLNLAPWRAALTPELLRKWQLLEEQELERPFLERLPKGTYLLTGVEVHDVQGERIERYVGSALFGPQGRMGRVAKKRVLVPGGETMAGLERFQWVRDLVHDSIGYLPDFQAGTETGILELPGRSGRDYRIAAMACFDNAFMEPALEAVAAGPVDFLTVTSNEAWYHDACEMDQMVAFSRILAVATGRSLLRVTNSGVSVLIGPDGREIERLMVGDRDRSVEGSLAVTVPVPADSSLGGPPYVRVRSFLRMGLLLFLGLLAWACRAPRAAAA